jgi:hypothetical protein
MALATTLLVIITGVYSLLTILPSLYPDCPYKTPLSGACWRVIQALESQQHITAHEKSAIVSDKTPVEFMLEEATDYSEKTRYA